MPKIPTPGQVVLFHFMSRQFGHLVLTTRPATVIVPSIDGKCGLHVMWWNRDSPATWLQPSVYSFGVHMMFPDVGDVPIAPDGIPADRTWTFRPEDL